MIRWLNFFLDNNISYLSVSQNSIGEFARSQLERMKLDDKGLVNIVRNFINIDLNDIPESIPYLVLVWVILFGVITIVR